MNSEPASVYLCLGSNLGNRQRNLDQAIEQLSQRLKMGPISSVYDTEPMGNTTQPRFLNLVCQATTRLEPQSLLLLVKGIELRLGRPRESKSGDPRPIDIDILFYDDQVVETEELIIPHPRLAEREFVLVPLDEIAPEMVHPVSGLTVSQMRDALTEKQGVFKWEETA